MSVIYFFCSHKLFKARDVRAKLRIYNLQQLMETAFHTLIGLLLRAAEMKIYAFFFEVIKKTNNK